MQWHVAFRIAVTCCSAPSAGCRSAISAIFLSQRSLTRAAVHPRTTAKSRLLLQALRQLGPRVAGRRAAQAQAWMTSWSLMCWLTSPM